MKKLVILTSNAGTGSNLQAIIDAISQKKLDAIIASVISDKVDSIALDRAKKNHIPTILCPTKEVLLDHLKKLHPDYIVLSGWRQIITDNVIFDYTNKILNLHPGIIPDNPHGKSENPDGTEALWNKGMFTDTAIKNVLSTNTSYAGSSIHFLTKEFDFGPVVGKTFEKVLPNDTIESLYMRLKKKENKLYVEVLQKLCNS